MKQKRFDVLKGETPTIINASESHMALVFVLDISHSMRGAAIKQLNEGLNRFKDEVCRDKQTKDILDVAIIEFNDEYKVVQPFVPIEFMNPVKLEASGPTKFTGPIREALKMVDERSRFYRRSGSEPYKPWILLVTDGGPLDDITEVTKEVWDMQEDGKVRFIALGVGGYHAASLKKLTDIVFRMEGTDFTSFFDWVGKSMRSVSTTAPGEKPPLPTLEGNITRDVSDIFW
ncbi:MAG: VWA domain-containing protein [Defluviitaleaceae bacterium]|nr:VWA domain-containing protein [Defluviitaleaceae bacterium]